VFSTPAYPEVSISRIYRALDPATNGILQLSAQYADGNVVRVRDVVLAIEHLEPEVVLCLPDLSIPNRTPVLEAAFNALDLTPPPKDRGVKFEVEEKKAGLVKKAAPNCFVHPEQPQQTGKESLPCTIDVTAHPVAIRLVDPDSPPQPAGKPCCRRSVLLRRMNNTMLCNMPSPICLTIPLL